MPERAGGDVEDSAPITVAQALARSSYLKARGGDIYNAARVRVHLPDVIALQAVALLTVKELRRWRDSLIGKGLAASTVNRNSAHSRPRLSWLLLRT